MRFKTKFDRWLVVVLILPAIPLAFLAASGRVAPGVLFLAIWLVVLLCTLPQYYEVRDDGLFLRQGWRKSLLPYPSIVEIQSMTDSRGAGVFSLDRILIVDRNGKRFQIAVAEEERFLDELSRRCPQLDRKPFGFGMPLSTPSDI